MLAVDRYKHITKKEVYQFLKTIPIAVFGTISAQNSPHLVTKYYVVDEELHFYFITKSETSKMDDIQRNSKVSIVVSDKDTYKTVEASGVAVKLTGLEKIKTIIKMITEVYSKQGLIKANNFFNWPPQIEKLEKGENSYLSSCARIFALYRL